jgi:hypothetical protein
MGYPESVSAEASGLTEHDAAQSARDGLAADGAAHAPIAGCALRNGQMIRFTLDTTAMARADYRVPPEQIAIAALVLASFFAPLWHLVG